MVYGLAAHPPVNYAKSPYGQFDPALLVQARKRITAAKESWSGLSAGEMSKLKAVQDQFSLIVDSITKLLPSGQALSKALMGVAEASLLWAWRWQHQSCIWKRGLRILILMTLRLPSV
jgi:chemosensory pili system protein ChpA (sensor histidine kinase/response regulator)